ncbi:MAG: hypothetical protein A2087_01225 [Spirochaetes bacterium GWD1_61_31]|nr:MAG: hypothetical protein A2Y37_12810 [Spirochaetes bacterium GWB1_60_80]OHD28664.1 MAG: hypothetical protein A2004_05755 [Spirochaetes bacterium GWC1_61_12]OHD34953.1 MAG: hypothetical protein A2087_01225 [Spirochaetes bacterium GWD1_61_31]OHD43306.1 MAG: hypothetical protein A2Y35_08505 [Spirochaetes bacterium GWE1_60_18]OHD58844.1 MAG: hypothetical protein A2Y32_08875 [Spirochaetes bacterium GWF1_60_12]
MSQYIMDLQVVLSLAYLTNALLSVLLAGSGLNFKGAWWWVLAQSLMALGTLGDALAPLLPPWLPLIVANTAYAAASIFYIHSVWVFRFQKPFPPWLYLISLLQLASFSFGFFQPYQARALLFSAWMSLGPLATAGLLLWKVERRFWLANSLTALPFLILGLASASRLALLASLALQGEVLVTSTQNVWYTAGAILLSTIMLFGYFMMSSIQTVQVLNVKDGQIEARNRKLVEAAKAKDLFFAIIAHDIRGPIGGAARYVRKHLFGHASGLEAKSAEMDTLASSLERTNEYLEKLLWWSRTQLQDWVPAKLEIALDHCLDHAVSLLKTRIELKHLSVELPGSPCSKACADPESIQLILNNLLSNAVKYSPPGRVVTVAADRDGAFCRVQIRDQGIGMSQETLGRLFRIEEKISVLGTAAETGNGLGLILAKSLAERNGCRIELESALGVGTCARLWLPLAADA